LELDGVEHVANFDGFVGGEGEGEEKVERGVGLQQQRKGHASSSLVVYFYYRPRRRRRGRSCSSSKGLS